ncbi:glutamine synthetase III family protein [Reichenbachiella versicolor]|uniref:glutamine synthetase III family protein n=1 Tax=Reichenbachiella versicolor TaxID=1821036 RepID=UPI000D6E922E|nr:glutamine synthetase III [Reichenbachiella versicolor]
MAHLRFKALDHIQSRSKVGFDIPAGKVSDYFGELAFGLKQMRVSLSSDSYEKVAAAIKQGKKIEIETAEAIASAVKTWAISKGVTHYTHWFQPLTGATAEKHDTFFNPQQGIEEFKGSELVQQEPDASMFPSGGIRSMFEARGYTAWDPSSPIFIMDTTLCIPTVFVAFTGESLDYKAPLLKSMDALDRAATRICKLFDRNVTHVTPYLGWEQEYFVVDKALFEARPDLVMANRTVFGHNPARGHQLDDHYFGRISPRMLEFIKEFEYEAHRLGIPVKTRHNEVAPSQFECAPMHEEANKSADHNQLLKDVMDRVASKHNLRILFHDKPFETLNGNSKHNNWSLSTDTGINLFQPSNSARENLQFLIFFICTIRAVYEHTDLLRASVATAGNDMRLGEQDAPPAIMSVFIGEQLSKVLENLQKNKDIKLDKGDNVYMKLGIDKIPEIILDNTDRNRTSPFAFTGNKFEFRAVGSSVNVSNPITVLNTIVADQLTEFYKTLNKDLDAGTERKIAIINLLREYVSNSKKILFEGDGHSKEWQTEAIKRKLSNTRDTARAMDAFISKKTVDVFKRMKVLSEMELQARHEIMLENYIMKIQIESRVMGDLGLNHILPIAVAYQNKLIQNAQGLQQLGIDNAEVIKTIKEVSKYASQLKADILKMIDARKIANKQESYREKAISYCDEVKGEYFDMIRYAVDKLELYVDNEDWPLVKYRELLFIR